MIFHWRQCKWQTQFALLQELPLLSLASFCQSRAELSPEHMSCHHVDRPWPRAGCFCTHSTIDTHCTARNLKKIPAGLIKKILREKLCRSWARQWGAIQYNRWRLCCRELHGMFQVSWGLKWYFGKIIFPQYHFKPRDRNIPWCSLLQKSPSV